jgi:TrmH family RNA methyltransferase
MLTAAELDRLCVVLIGSRNPLNIGAAARAMSNFGFLHLRVVHPYDVAFREARSGVDAEPVLSAAEEFKSVAAAVGDCSLVVGTTGDLQRTAKDPLHRLETAAELVRERLHAGSRVALLFGSEKVGLSNHDLSHCQVLLRIPTRTEHPSMNLGQSVAIVLYELIRQTPRQPSPADPDTDPISELMPQPPWATAAERERMIEVLLAILDRSGFGPRGPGPSLEEKLRRLVRHLDLTQPDLQEWLGLLRHILWKLENGNRKNTR